MDFIEPYKHILEQYCVAYQVEELYLFGSAAIGDMHANSDVDLMVRFKPIDPALYFENYCSFKSSLESLFARKVDLLEVQTLKNPVLIRSIERSKERVYG